jgi:hypothetical protein
MMYENVCTVSFIDTLVVSQPQLILLLCQSNIFVMMFDITLDTFNVCDLYFKCHTMN